jgi:EmrB/QacA subfamily drug resistance transporter
LTTLANITNRQKSLVMVGVALSLLLFAIDQTIVATAMPKIVSELHGLEHLSWVVTAYLLASTVSVPLWGKFSDLFGRKWLFVGSIIIFLVGSLLSGASQSMTQLIIFRGLQGLGGGGMMSNSFAIIADLFPPAERGKWQGVLGGIFGLASVIGPFLGGWITDNASWRWTFYVNLPIGIVALAAIIYLMPAIKSLVSRSQIKIDWWGSALLTVSLVSILLACVWGGTQYAWDSATIISLFAVGAVTLAAFIFAETKAADPIIPLGLFKNSIFTTSVIVTFLMGMAMFGVILYIPLFAQGVLGTNATGSGAILTPLMFGLIGSSIVSGQVISRTGKYKFLAVTGLIIAVSALWWLSTMTTSTTNGELVARMVAMGIGLGITMPIFNIVVQNAFDNSKIGVVTSATQLFRNLGSTIGTAILGTVFINTLSTKAAGLSSQPFVAQVGTQGPINFSHPDSNQIQALLSAPGQQAVTGAFAQLPAPARASLSGAFGDYVSALKTVYAGSITHLFIVGMAIVAVALIFTFFLKEVPLRGRAEAGERGAAEEAGIELAIEEGMIAAKDEPVAAGRRASRR